MELHHTTSTCSKSIITNTNVYASKGNTRDNHPIHEWLLPLFNIENEVFSQDNVKDSFQLICCLVSVAKYALDTLAKDATPMKLNSYLPLIDICHILLKVATVTNDLVNLNSDVEVTVWCSNSFPQFITILASVMKAIPKITLSTSVSSCILFQMICEVISAMVECLIVSGEDFVNDYDWISLLTFMFTLNSSYCSVRMVHSISFIIRSSYENNR